MARLQAALGERYGAPGKGRYARTAPGARARYCAALSAAASSTLEDVRGTAFGRVVSALVIGRSPAPVRRKCSARVRLEGRDYRRVRGTTEPAVVGDAAGQDCPRRRGHPRRSIRARRIGSGSPLPSDAPMGCQGSVRRRCGQTSDGHSGSRAGSYQATHCRERVSGGPTDLMQDSRRRRGIRGSGPPLDRGARGGGGGGRPRGRRSA